MEASLSHLTRKTTEYRDKGEGHCGADTRPRGSETQIPLMFRYERKWGDGVGSDERKE